MDSRVRYFSRCLERELPAKEEAGWREWGREIIPSLPNDPICLLERDDMSQHDPVNHPPQYTSSAAKCGGCGKQIECIDVTRHLSFNLGNAVKYVWRVDLKNKPIEDLEKAVWYLRDEIERRKKGK